MEGLAIANSRKQKGDGSSDERRGIDQIGKEHDHRKAVSHHIRQFTECIYVGYTLGYRFTYTRYKAALRYEFSNVATKLSLSRGV